METLASNTSEASPAAKTQPAIEATYVKDTSAEMQMLDELGYGSVGAPSESQTIEPEGVTAEKTSRLRKITKSIGRVVLREGLGTALDTATIAAGLPLMTRELLGSAGDIGVNHLTGAYEEAEVETHKPSRARRIGHIAVGFSAAILAQKFGPGVIDHIYNLDHGLLSEYAVPLSSKLAATSGASAAYRRLI